MHSPSTPKFSTGYRQRDVNQVHPLVLESGKKNTGDMSIKIIKTTAGLTPLRFDKV